jgi:hypothetical protein
MQSEMFDNMVLMKRKSLHRLWNKFSVFLQELSSERSYEELTVRDLDISVRREQTLRSFMPLTGEQPPMPREIIAVEVSARLELQEPLDLDLLANIAKDIKDAGLKASCHAGEIQVKISLPNIPLT